MILESNRVLTSFYIWRKSIKAYNRSLSLSTPKHVQGPSFLSIETPETEEGEIIFSGSQGNWPDMGKKTYTQGCLTGSFWEKNEA